MAALTGGKDRQVAFRITRSMSAEFLGGLSLAKHNNFFNIKKI
jgi:hypothetical protein